MKKILAAFFTAIFVAGISAGQYGLSGTIKSYFFNSPVASCFIQLRPESPTAKADSMYSDVNGRYLFPDIWPGVYTILVNHTDYLKDSLYLAIDTQKVADFELLKKANVYLTDLPDTLKKAQSPIIIGKTIDVNHSLFIEPGVLMLLLGGMTIKGENLTAIGRKNDSITIVSREENIALTVFTPVQRYRFCSFKLMSMFYISPDTISVPKTGIRCEFDSCRFSDVQVFTANYDFYGNPSLTSIILQDSHFEKGNIYIGCDTLICKRNILKTPLWGNIESSAIITNNDFFFAFSMGFGLSTDTIENNVFSSVELGKNSSWSMMFAYNDLMLLVIPFPGIGKPVISNDNGEPCDLFFNIFSDPQITDQSTGALLSTSPCIRAGKNGSNIGVWQGTSAAIAPDKNRNLRLSAGGARQDYSLSMQVNSGRASNLQAPANVYSLNGRRLAVLTNTSNDIGSVKKSARASGAYVLEMRFLGKR